MKKALSILLTLVILLLAPPFALAGEPVPEENSGEEPAADVKAAEEAAALPAELFDLWDYGGESPVWVSTAVPISEGILLAPERTVPYDSIEQDYKELIEKESERLNTRIIIAVSASAVILLGTSFYLIMKKKKSHENA